MTETKIILVKKPLAVIAAMIVGFLVPYLSRIPLAFRLRNAVDLEFKIVINE